jgi:cystathionine beta-synthase
MSIYNSVLEAIGKTPLIKLNKVTRGLKSTIYVKAEFLNPGGSVKDRIGLKMLELAEERGLVKPGSTIIEATAGNTGVGLALVSAIKGYRCIFVMPDKMSQDKVNLLRAYGAEVVITPTSVPPDSPESYNSVADRLASEIPGAFRPSQFTNPDNPLTHFLTTGPEIWEDTNGRVDVFVAGMGTGGTISGTGRFLKQQNPSITVVGADPQGSILSGDSPKSYKVEGIGEDFIPKTFDRQAVDEMIRVSDNESFQTARRLAREEAMLVGGSSGTAVAAALKYAQRLDSPKFIVVLAPDTGRNYINKFYSDAWMQENGFNDVYEEPALLRDVLQAKKHLPPIIALSLGQTLADALLLMQKHNISQLPVLKDRAVVGSVSEGTLLSLLHEGINLSNQQLGAVMGKPVAMLSDDAPVSEAYRLLLSTESGIIITREKTPVGFLTKTDLIYFWSTNRN